MLTLFSNQFGLYVFTVQKSFDKLFISEIITFVDLYNTLLLLFVNMKINVVDVYNLNIIIKLSSICFPLLKEKVRTNESLKRHALLSFVQSPLTPGK